MSFEIKILGSNSAMPAYGRHHTSQLLRIQKHHFLLDCGESTQSQLVRYRCKPQKINHIFISHLHGDHYLGLMGLIFSMHLLKRTSDLFIYGQRGLQEIITTQLKYSDSTLNYNIVFRELNPEQKELLFEDKLLEVHSFPLSHRIPCCGFLFREKTKPIRINKETLPKNISLQNIASLKKGEDVLDDDGKIRYKNKDLTLPPKKSRSYAFCSDTCYDEKLIPHIKGVDMLYHESTFLMENELQATNTYHSTAAQAATIAKKSKVEKLLLGHFSARYKDISPFLEEAKLVFENSILATEGEVYKIPEI